MDFTLQSSEVQARLSLTYIKTRFDLHQKKWCRHLIYQMQHAEGYLINQSIYNLPALMRLKVSCVMFR